MAELNTSIPHFYAKMRIEHLYQHDGRKGMQDVIVFGVQSIGGKALTFVNGYLDVEALPSPGGVMSFKADDITWSNLTTDDDAYYGIVYYDSGDPNSSPILGYITFASPLQAVDEDLPIEWTGGFVGSISLDISNPVNPPWSRLWMSALTSAFEQKYVWGDDNWRMALMKTTWSPDQDTQFTWNDISDGELEASGGYGQETLAFTGGSITYEATPNYGGTINLKADATVTFTGVTSSDPFQWAVIYYNVDPYPLLGYMKLDQSYSTTGQNTIFTILGGGIVFSVSLDTAADT